MECEWAELSVHSALELLMLEAAPQVAVRTPHPGTCGCVPRMLLLISFLSDKLSKNIST